MATTTGKEKTRKPREKRKSLEGQPKLLTHRQVADYFQVTASGLRKWVAKGKFPTPHSVISQTWYYREDVILHRIKTGEWPQGVSFIAL